MGDGLVDEESLRGKTTMTQLLLFDAPAADPPAITPSAANDPTPPGTTKSDAPGLSDRRRRGPVDDHQPGMHRMGDLARLVLMRYDMVAKRRAEWKEKRRSEIDGVRF